MEICLINPPLSVHEFQHLALPLLKGYLESNSVKCTTRDFNVEIMDKIIFEGLHKVETYFYERGMKIGYNEICNRFNEARNVFRREDMIGKEDRAQKLINTYLRIAGSDIFDICFKPDTLKKIKDGYDKVDVSKDRNIIISFIRENILTFIKNKNFKIVGISIPFTSQIFYALIIGREIKRLMPDCRVIMGGPQISLFGKVFARHKPFREAFDALSSGMGELSTLEFIKAVYENRDFRDVPNLMYFDKNGEFTINPEKKIENVSLIPIPDFSDLPLDKYIYSKLPYQMSRGCYWSKCAFCSYRNNKGYNIKSVDEVINHFSIFKSKYGIHNFQFIDDAIPPKTLKSFADRLLNDNFKIRYDAYLRLDKGFTPQICNKLAESGLKTVLFGFESANQRMLDLMNKGNTPENMLDILKNMKNAGINSILSCLIGFPTETREEAWDSIEFLYKYRKWYYWVYIVHFGLISDMCSHAHDYGLYDVDYSELIRYDDTGFVALGYPYKTSIGMSVSEAYDRCV